MLPMQEMELNGLKAPVYTANAIVVGTGAAGLNAANRLFREMEEIGVENPQDRIAIVTQGVGLGTSNNSGSDKQTYYKMGTFGEEADKASDFATTLTAGGCTHADHAFIEGANSLRGFYRLCDLGVPFPHNEEGGFIGYKTDHDPRQRGTSAGPWTSRFMVKKLLAETNRLGIQIFNQHHLLAVIKNDKGELCGLLCVDVTKQKEANHGLVVFRCGSAVMAGGGPGELYKISVYPKGQMGPYAALFEAGVQASNLTELQFGLASIDPDPRWNLSGTYQQVIPRYFSTDQDGNDEQDFLNPWFSDMSTMATDIFLKGYQWPFDHDKVAGEGSSLIDILVQNEMINKGRRVFMDFRENPRGGDGLDEFTLDCLKPEALEYLEKSGAMQATPIKRLAHMNQPSIDLYKMRSLDLWEKPLEIGICAQHCNGGFAVDEWWESNVTRLFVVGELAGTHGVKRPGGSALNAGQVGSLRAAQRIAHIYFQDPESSDAFDAKAAETIGRFVGIISKMVGEGKLDQAEERKKIQHRMSAFAGMVRSKEGLRKALDEASAQWDKLRAEGLKAENGRYVKAMETYEIALTQQGFLKAMLALLERGGGSRGSHLVLDPSGGIPHEKLGDAWRFIPENLELRNEILTVSYDAEAGEFKTTTVDPRAHAGKDGWFENTWAQYRTASIFQKNGDEPAMTHEAYQKAQ